jgi:hypothetical protein
MPPRFLLRILNNILYAVHFYDWSPMQQLKWKTPHRLFYKSKSNLSLIWVFGCSAHMFLPDEIQKNKLSARSELMIFLGYDGSNYQFIRHLNCNVVFMSPHAIFDETYFPRCPSSNPMNLKKQINQEITRHSSPDKPNDVIELDDLFSHPHDPPPGPPPQPPHHHNLPSPPRPPSPRLPSPTPGPSRPKQFPPKEKPHCDKGKWHAESPPNESERWLQCLERGTQVPNRPGNVYGNKLPAKILHDYDKQPFTPNLEEQIRSRVPPDLITKISEFLMMMSLNVVKKFADNLTKPKKGPKSGNNNTAINYLLYHLDRTLLHLRRRMTKWRILKLF